MSASTFPLCLDLELGPRLFNIPIVLGIYTIIMSSSVVNGECPAYFLSPDSLPGSLSQLGLAWKLPVHGAPAPQPVQCTLHREIPDTGDVK